MDKRTAIKLLGGSGHGSITRTANRLGVTTQAVCKWPDQLTDRIRARIVAELAGPYLPPSLRVALGCRGELDQSNSGS
jgi:transposase-like protein